ncbi:MAG TPA: hydroxyisourate hydrolase [Herpetosiphonaceae bacterium]|nr:hydroxyisourate hydrolase [Herpetosiphonaceae bacterium]
MPGRLTTHVLDTAQGRPAGRLAIELWRIEAGGAERLLKTALTNADGRTDGPLLDGADFQPGAYQIVFLVGAYFAGQPLAAADPPFLDRVPVRFAIADPDGHYHVPLLVSPWAYSTYRGS